MSSPFLTERGPEAAATQARLTDRRWVLQGEGDSAWSGRDGDTYCLCSEGGTALDSSDAADVSEGDVRAASTVRRFPSAEALDDAVSSLAGEVVRQRGWAVQDPELPTSSTSSLRFELVLTAGLSASKVTVVAEDSDAGRCTARYEATFHHRAQATITVEIEADEWARFKQELLLLRAQDWRQYLPLATDGLDWSMRLDWLSRTEAGGCNAYPPDGLGTDTSQEFERLLVVVGRLLGFDPWPDDHPSDLADIPDERDRLEHLLLVGLRAWAAETAEAETAPGELTEAHFESGLVAQLERVIGARRQVDVNGLMAGWPRVGKLDIELRESGLPTWVELKWVKRANEFHNCLWDAAKLAQGVREGHARYGYLVAGASMSAWQRGNAPSRLFSVSSHQDSSLVADYPAWWPFWAEENPHTYPLELPTPVITVPVGRVRLSGSGGKDWMIRVARVEAPGALHFSPRV